MATNAIYTEWLDEVAFVSLTRDPHTFLLLSGAYVPDQETHTTRSDIPGAAIIAEASAANPRVENGIYFCDDVVFTGVDSNVAAVTIALANQATGRLVVFLQTVTGLQSAANGTDLVLMFDPDCGVFGV